MARRRRRVRTLTGWLKWLWHHPKVAVCMLTAYCLMAVGCASPATYRRAHTETIVVDGMMITDSWAVESTDTPPDWAQGGE